MAECGFVQRLGGLSARVSPDPALCPLHSKKNKKLELLISDREARARAAYQLPAQEGTNPISTSPDREKSDGGGLQSARSGGERGLPALCSARRQSSSREQQQVLRTTAQRTAVELEMQRTAAELEQINRSLGP
jgi:hypothetical protein